MYSTQLPAVMRGQTAGVISTSESIWSDPKPLKWGPPTYSTTRKCNSQTPPDVGRSPSHEARRQIKEEVWDWCSGRHTHTSSCGKIGYGPRRCSVTSLLHDWSQDSESRAFSHSSIEAMYVHEERPVLDYPYPLNPVTNSYGYFPHGKLGFSVFSFNSFQQHTEGCFPRQGLRLDSEFSIASLNHNMYIRLRSSEIEELK